MMQILQDHKVHLNLCEGVVWTQCLCQMHVHVHIQLNKLGMIVMSLTN